jgi:hypothetical protein
VEFENTNINCTQDAAITVKVDEKKSRRGKPVKEPCAELHPRKTDFDAEETLNEHHAVAAADHGT